MLASRFANPRALALGGLGMLVAACVAPGDLLLFQFDGRRSNSAPRTEPTAPVKESWRPTIAPVPARPSREPAFVANLDPLALLGLARADIAALLGPPKLLRRDPPAEMWQYQSEACVVHVFLYSAPANAGYRVRHVEVRGRKSESAPVNCYAGLINALGAISGAG